MIFYYEAFADVISLESEAYWLFSFLFFFLSFFCGGVESVNYVNAINVYLQPHYYKHQLKQRLARPQPRLNRRKQADGGMIVFTKFSRKAQACKQTT